MNKFILEKRILDIKNKIVNCPIGKLNKVLSIAILDDYTYNFDETISKLFQKCCESFPKINALNPEAFEESITYNELMDFFDLALKYSNNWNFS